MIAGILLPGVPFAIETAPRLSDREIIESLAEIKAEFKVIHERFEAVEQRMDAEFKRMDQRFERMDRRMAEGFSEQMNVTLMLFGSSPPSSPTIAWDRRTAVKPLEQKLDAVEEKITRLELALQRDLDLASPEGPSSPASSKSSPDATNPSLPTSSTPRCSAAAGCHRSSALDSRYGLCG